MDRMDKFFKSVCVALTFLILFSSLSVLGLVARNGLKVIDIDLFNCREIVSMINNMEMNMTSVVYVQDKSGKWNEYCRLHGEENRIWVSKDKIPENLKKAFVAIEDQNFYNHAGVDWKRTGAAFLDWLPNINFLKGEQGGSTLTQQLIKNVTSDNDRDASRKFREIIRALTIEKSLSKDTIMEAYLNTISLGNGICGVQVAANYYFNKDVSKLSLAECACLAAITKNPSAYNPIAHLKDNEDRLHLVLNYMYQQDLISYDDYVEAYDTKIKIDNTQKNTFEQPVYNYFIDALIDNVIDDLSKNYKCSRKVASTMLYNGGYKIYATMDQDIQNTMESVYKNTSRYFSQKRNGENVQSSMTIMDYEGHVVGVVGGVGEKTVNRALNRAINSPRQPGSTMKPIGVYAPAIDNGTIYYSSIVEDKPLERYYADGNPGPKEWYGSYIGNMTVQMAIEKSANTIPCHILKEMGVETSYKFLTEKLGLKHLTENDKNLAALALGGCSYGITSQESAAAYAVFGNGGKYYSPKTYYRVEKANGEIVLKDGENIQAINPETSTIMNKLLQNVVYGSNGTGGGIRSYSSMKAYAKTGTSSESNDLWMVAGTPYYVGSVWYGFDNNGTVYNPGAAARVWCDIMRSVHKNLETKEFDKLTEIEPIEYCKYSGKLRGKNCYSSVQGYFVSTHIPDICDGKHIWSLNDFSATSDEEDFDYSDLADSPSNASSTNSSVNTASDTSSNSGTTSTSETDSSTSAETSQTESTTSQNDTSSASQPGEGTEQPPDISEETSPQPQSSP